MERSCGWPSWLTQRLRDRNRQAGKTGMWEEMRLHNFCLSHEKSVCEDEIFFPRSMIGWASRRKSQRAAKGAASCPTRPFEDSLPENNWLLTNKAFIISSMEFTSFRKISPTLVQNLILRKLFSIQSVTVRQVLDNRFNNIKNYRKNPC